jgi:eukaryotic-like serine/threonine-protein kinase
MTHTLVQRWASLSPLLDELLELDEPARAARLASLREHDAPLADDLTALLAKQPGLDAEGFLEGGALAIADEATLAGRAIGAYTLIEPIGAGGMGSVWLAQRSDGRFEGRVAVKLLNLALLGHGGAERFAREGHALARLAHPNIARLLDAGVNPTGQPYLVIEHVEGEAIDRHCESQALDVNARVRLMLHVLAAVAHAHGKLVLHRDLKPANILVTAEGQVKLLDFGIAKLIDDDTQPAPATEVTQLAGRAFTADFAAPEQVQGGDVTTATDVYALGVLLYVLLSGEHPTAQATHTPVDRLRSVVETEPPRLSDAAERVPVNRHRATALRGDLDNIAAKALRKRPADRYPTAAAFADDLRRYLDNEPVAARADTFGYVAAKFVRRHRWGVGTAAAVFITLVAGVIGTGWQAIEVRRERDEALFQAERALAKGNLFNLLLSGLGDTDRPLTRGEILERSEQLVQKQFGNDPRVAIDLLLPIAGQYLTLGDTRREFEVMQQAAALAQKSGDPVQVAQVACDTVDTAFRLGRREAALQQLRTGLDAMARISAPGVVLQASCLRAQADAARAQGDLVRATDHIRQALAVAERGGRTRGNLYSSLQSYLQVLLRDRDDWRGMEDLITQRMRQMEARGEAGSIDYVGTLRDQAMVHMARGEVLAAQAVLDPLVSRWRAEGDHGVVPVWFDTARGGVMLRLGAFESARMLLAHAAQRARDQGNLPLAVSCDLALAQTLLALGDVAGGEHLLDGIEPSAAAPSAWRITPAMIRAEAALARGRTAQAAQDIDAEIVRMNRAPNAVALAAALRLSARAHLQAGDLPMARKRAGAALDTSQRVARRPEASADVGEALLLLAQVEQAGGEDARATARRAEQGLTQGLGADHALTRAARVLSE